MKTKKPLEKNEKSKKPVDKKKPDVKVEEPKTKKDAKLVSVDTAKVEAEAKKTKDKSRKEEKKVVKQAKVQLGDPKDVQNLISHLAQEAILIRVKTTVWRGTGTDKDWAAQLAGQAGGTVDGFSVGLKYMPPTFRTELNNRVAVINKLIKENSLAWGDGWHLLATVLYEPLKKAVEEARISIREYVAQITTPANHEVIKKYAKTVLGSAYNEERVPSAVDIRDKFNVQLDTDTVHIPTKLEGIASDEMASLKQEMMDTYAVKYQSAIMDLIEGLKESMESLVEELEGSQDRIKYQTILRMCESRIHNIQRLDIFKSKRVYRALEAINDGVLNPLRESLFVLKKDAGKRKDLVAKTKKVMKDALDDVRV